MATTSPDNIWIPDTDSPMVLDTMFSTLASSIQNGIGARVKKLESFVGCYIRATGTLALPPTSASQPLTVLGVTGFRSFISGVTLSNGVITIITSGIYTVTCSVAARRDTAGSAVGRVAAYLIVSGNRAMIGTTNTSQIDADDNCAAFTVNLQLNSGDTVSVEAIAAGYPMTVRNIETTNLSCALVSAT